MKDLMNYRQGKGTNPKDAIGSTKAPLTLVPPAPLVLIAEAMRNGSSKYGPYNWRDEEVTLSEYINAADRHLKAYYDGEECATDSGIHHLAHAAAGILILMDAGLSGTIADDRPKAGGTARVIKEASAHRLEQLSGLTKEQQDQWEQAREDDSAHGESVDFPGGGAYLGY